MGATMKLIDTIRDLNSLDAEGTIYASLPWAPDSEAIVAREPQVGGLPLEAAQLGLSYFLEVFIARDFLSGWTVHLAAKPTLHQLCARLIEYAANDA
jgi:hypothetical protein